MRFLVLMLSKKRNTIEIQMNFYLNPDELIVLDLFQDTINLSIVDEMNKVIPIFSYLPHGH